MITIKEQKALRALLIGDNCDRGSCEVQLQCAWDLVKVAANRDNESVAARLMEQIPEDQLREKVFEILQDVDAVGECL